MPDEKSIGNPHPEFRKLFAFVSPNKSCAILFKERSGVLSTMARLKHPNCKTEKEFLDLARELRIKLREMDQKLDHLIRSHRHFYSLHYKDRELTD